MGSETPDVGSMKRGYRIGYRTTLCFILLIIAAYIYSLKTRFKEETPLSFACGEWKSKYYQSSFFLYEKDNGFFIMMEREKWGKYRVDTYRVTEFHGRYLVDIGFTMVLSYDGVNDALFLMPMGEYIRSEK
jgi:hypothetical protein